MAMVSKVAKRMHNTLVHSLLNQMHVVVFSESVFHAKILLYPHDISFRAFSCVVLFVCWPNVGPQDIKT